MSTHTQRLLFSLTLLMVLFMAGIGLSLPITAQTNTINYATTQAVLLTEARATQVGILTQAVETRSAYATQAIDTRQNDADDIMATREFIGTRAAVTQAAFATNSFATRAAYGTRAAATRAFLSSEAAATTDALATSIILQQEQLEGTATAVYGGLYATYGQIDPELEMIMQAFHNNPMAYDVVNNALYIDGKITSMILIERFNTVVAAQDALPSSVSLALIADGIIYTFIDVQTGSSISVVFVPEVTAGQLSLTSVTSILDGEIIDTEALPTEFVSEADERVQAVILEGLMNLDDYEIVIDTVAVADDTLELGFWITQRPVGE